MRHRTPPRKPRKIGPRKPRKRRKPRKGRAFFAVFAAFPRDVGRRISRSNAFSRSAIRRRGGGSIYRCGRANRNITRKLPNSSGRTKFARSRRLNANCSDVFHPHQFTTPRARCIIRAMDSIDANASEIESAVENPSETAPDALAVPTLDVEVATVCVVDGIWQDQPDNVASFGEARLGDFARGRGNLYICLDVSGEVEGRSDIERALVEVIRDTYASSRGSVSFGLSEALRAANAYLYDNNRQVPREQRRMAGVSAVVLRGSDLYICQAGPAVVLVEAAEKLARYPAESDWFTEDAPLIAPQGTASAPLGIRREFASDLAHTSVSVGDVFVLATRGLTQLATTEELAIAFTERSAQEIGAYLEELGQDADLTALVAELVDARTHAISLSDDTHNESIPVPLDALVLPDEDEPELEQPVDAEPEPAPAWDTRAAPANADAEAELNWDADDALPEDAPYVEADSGTSVEPAKIESESEPAPVYASAAAAMPMMRAPAFPAPQPEPLDYEAELERRRAERAARRAAQNAAIQRVVGGIVAAMALVGGAVSGLWHRAFG